MNTTFGVLCDCYDWLVTQSVLESRASSPVGTLLLTVIAGLSTNQNGNVSTPQILKQDTGGSVTTISAALVDNPYVETPASVPMITKGGLNAVTISLANEYAKKNIRFNAVAPGVVDTPMHETGPKDFLKSLSPMGTISDSKEIADAVVYLTEARHVTGEVLHVDGGAHVGRW